MSLAATNPAVILGRYATPEGERLVQGQRILGVVRLTDVPADEPHGRRYLIERELHTAAEVDALLSDYLAQAERLHAIPADPASLQLEGGA